MHRSLDFKSGFNIELHTQVHTFSYQKICKIQSKITFLQFPCIINLRYLHVYYIYGINYVDFEHLWESGELPRRQVAVVTRVSMEVDWCGIRLSQLYWEVCLSQLTSSLASLRILLSYACNNKHSVFLIHSICIFYSLS